MIDLRNMFGDPAFRPFTPRTSYKICCPNKLWSGSKDGKKLGVLVAQRSSTRPNGDWPLNVNGVNYVLTAECEGRIDAGYVLLVDKPDVFVAQGPIKTVFARLRDQPTCDGKFGTPHWWVTTDFRPTLKYEDAF